MLFTEDAVWDGGALGCYRGRKAIQTFFRETAPQIFSFSMHQVMNPLIAPIPGEAKSEGTERSWGQEFLRLSKCTREAEPVHYGDAPFTEVNV
jgi:hypothetical protein